MALFQPVWVFPDQRNGIGQGTIDATQDLTVSWHVTGSSELRNYQITIYQNNSASTQVYTTGKINTGCPFYGTTSSGEPKFFSYTISAATLASASITNGNEYKLIIQQWWNENSVEKSITQSSASVFITRAAPELMLDAWLNPGILQSTDMTFGAEYYQAQGDALNWFRWQIAFNDDREHPFFDTGNISGTMDISCYYDGFLHGNRYAYRCMCQTEHGVETATPWSQFIVDYAVEPTTGDLTAKCAGGTDAVLVEWTGVGYNPGELSPNAKYSISDDYVLHLEEGNILWAKSGEDNMNYHAPWTVIWKGRFVQGFSNQIFRINSGETGDIAFRYVPQAESVYLSMDGIVLYSQTIDANLEDVFTVIVTPNKVYIRREYPSGLAPSDSLVPSNSLAPMGNDSTLSQKFTASISYTQPAIKSFMLTAEQYCMYYEVIAGDLPADIKTAAYDNGTYVPVLDGGDYMLANWEDGLNVGTSTINGEVVYGYTLYRKNKDNTISRIAQVDTIYGKIYDYSAKSQQGPYNYVLFPYGKNQYNNKVNLSTAIQSDPIYPCWWNWTLIVCDETDSKDIFTVSAAYRFRLNVSTSAVSNNNNPNILQTFGRYPNVQLSQSNYRSGTLTALIGAVKTINGQPQYVDTIEVQDAIYALSTSQKPLFLKNRKGDMIRVRISAPITMQTGDEYKPQQQTIGKPTVLIA